MHKRALYRFIIIIVLLIGIILYLDINNRVSSYATPAEAIQHVEDPILSVNEIIETVYINDQYAYVYFYSDTLHPKDYLGISKIKKGKYGWKHMEMLGGGKITEDNVNGGLTSSDGEYLLGLASKEVANVTLKDQNAKLLPLPETDYQIWFFDQIEPTYLESELQFSDELGNLIN